MDTMLTETTYQNRPNISTTHDINTPNGGSPSNGGSPNNGSDPQPKHPKGLSWLFLVLAVVGIVHISYIFFWEYRQFKDRTLMLGKLEQSMHALRAETDLLEDTLDHELDLNYREQLARTQGFVYPEERLIASPKE